METVGHHTTIRNGHWFDINCKEAIGKKNEARLKMIRDTRTNREQLIKKKEKRFYDSKN